MKPTILLGMSGGTDSSVAAILLLEQGYEVIGITFRFWEHDENTHLQDARNLAERLGIRHITYDALDIFRSTVVHYFRDEYLAGRTPFPCAVCNNELKWKLILEQADLLGCEYVAMGHYVNKIFENGCYYISEGVDPDKDQSFFLWGLSNDQLKRIVFPLGGYYKSQVRQMAAERGFTAVSVKKDSLGACFCSGDYRPFLKSLIDNPDQYIFPGNFVDPQGNILGQHLGYPMYTVGQRRGLVYLNRKVFVQEIRPTTNEVVLADLRDMYRTEFYVNDYRLIDKTIFTDDFDTIVRIRYRKQNNKCRICFISEQVLKIELEDALESIAPGQTAVFYRDGKVLGGGFIV